MVSPRLREWPRPCDPHPERFILSSLNHSALFGPRTRLAAALALPIEYRRFDAVSLTCERWLARNYSAEYFTIEELHAWPAWAHPLDVRGAALRLGTVGRPAIPAWLSPP